MSKSTKYQQAILKIKSDLLSKKVGAIEATKLVWRVMPEDIKSLHAAKKLVDEWRWPKGKPQEVPQRQDSLTDQMKTVIQLAEKEGCYDAADWIKKRFEGDYV